MRKLSLAVLLMITPWSLAAESFALPLYAAGFVDRQNISLADERFHPVVGSVVFGTWLYEGVALEAEIGTSLTDDNVATLVLEPEMQISAGLRLESPPVDNIAAYALFAATGVSITSRFTSGNANSETYNFTGFRAVFGLTFSLSRRWAADAAFVTADYGDDFGITGFRAGVRYTLNNRRPRQRQGWLR